jgi:pimeloyl-ACP methyl ester carboxylesterase
VSEYQPRSYALEPGRRYPTVYLLPGLDGDDRSRFGDRSFVDALDAFGQTSGIEALLVGVSSRTAFGARYTNGRDAFAHTLTRSIVPAIEARFRAAAGAGKRVLAGQSTGGWNAITLALTCPGAFAAVAASAPDALDMESWLLDAEHRIRAPWLAWMRLEDAVKGPGQMTSLAHSFVSEGQAPRWPADLETGDVCRDVLDRWLEHSPLRRLQTAEGRAALRALRGRLFIGVARRDEFGLCEPAQRFCERLTALDVDHALLLEEGSHFDSQDRLAALVTMALRTLHT